MAPALEPVFASTRFRLLRRLGEGGMGVVYEALDLDSNTRVALKTISERGAGSLRRFKNEFRALQGIQHHNLVSLFELMQEDGRWFFTMELVDGVDFLRYVRSGDVETERVDSVTRVMRPSPDDPPAWSRGGTGRGRFDEARLRSVLEQLVGGLGALHRAGKVHRDIKPSNILVDDSGRTVILDFGLVADVDDDDADGLAGTVAFMAPESGTEAPVTPAADWYSVGMLLYVALTGREPFAGPPPEVLTLKRTVDPLPPRELCDGVPADLEELCMALLARDPAARPTGPQVAQWLRVARAVGDVDPAPRRFVGRGGPLTKLAEALDDVRAGHPVTLIIDGESGVGKTTLTERFLDDVRARRADALVLTGRCYERESVPYKALDEIVDALGRLPAMHADGGTLLSPSETRLLTQVFPALAPLVAGVPEPADDGGSDEPQAVRRALFTSLRALFRRLAAERPLVVHIDDLHWADEDSLSLLEALLRGPDAPALLFIATMQQSSTGARPAAVAARLPGDVRRLQLGTLPDEEARLMVAQLLDGALEREDDGIAREAGGHPLFIEALVQHRLGVGRIDGPARLEDALWLRIARLPASARRLMEAIAVAGGPIEQDVAAAAVDLDWSDFSRQVALLRAGHLVRTSGARRIDRVECYHDRVRETVHAHLGPEARRAWHQRLARAFERQERGDVETLAIHFRDAGERPQAIRYFGLAAERAQRALAFDRAARLYRECLALLPSGAREAQPLHVKVGDALANAGRGEAAARAYQLAAESEPSPLRAIELRRRAAEQLLRVGRLDEADELLRAVLGAVGMRMPATPAAALVELAARRAQLRLRRFRYRERAASELSAIECARIDTCWSIGGGFSVIDHLRGAVFQERHLLAALRAGEPYRIARAFITEAMMLSTRGPGSRALAARLTDEAAEIAARLGSPHLDALVHMSRALQSQFGGRFVVARASWEAAEVLLRARCTDVAWELTNVGFFLLQTLAWMGEVGELSRRLPLLVEAAEQRGDGYAATVLRTGWNVLPGLAADDPDRARADIAAAAARWQASGFHVQHYLALHAHAQLLLYEGRAVEARALLESQWGPMRRSLLLAIHPLRLDLLFLRLRAAVAVGAWREAEEDARRMLRHDRAWSTPLAELGLGAVACGNGDSYGALAMLASAERGFDGAGMAHFAAAARRVRGLLVGGAEGQRAVAAADAWMAGQGIRNVERWTALLAPGFSR